MVKTVQFWPFFVFVDCDLTLGPFDLTPGPFDLTPGPFDLTPGLSATPSP